MPNVGLSFSPTSGQQMSGQSGARVGQQGASSPVMDAIKILSFRVPQTLGVGAPVAPGLLAGAGGNAGSGFGNSAMLQQWLERFFGQGAQARIGQPAWNAGGQDWNTGAMDPMGSAAAAPSPTDPGDAMGAGSQLPSAAPAFQFRQEPQPSAPPAQAPSFGDWSWKQGPEFQQVFD